MTDTVNPIRDIFFILFQYLSIQDQVWLETKYKGLSQTDIEAIIKQFAKFSNVVVAPTNRVGDLEGVKYENGNVTVPSSMVKVYEDYVAQGWSTLIYPTEYGGQNLPFILMAMHNEIFSNANMSLSTYVGLSQFATSGIEKLGTIEQKQMFLPNMVAGNWTGTMCITEPHCGTDVGLIKTKAVSTENGTYKIYGTKIFISGGEHDLADNIIHMVLARLEGATSGVNGLSLFIVPKRAVDKKNIDKHNKISCSGIEHKMGIHGSATCTLNFEGSIGYLVGNENEGLKGMFVCMNEARLGTAAQSLGVADAAFDKSYHYAKERLQSKSIEKPNKFCEADPIIVHADVRRMLMVQKSLIEGSRALNYYVATLIDRDIFSERDSESDFTEFLTPICKGFITEISVECCIHAIQIFGGHGYVGESGVEQHLRDVKITTLYEGTTGIQGLDLLARKILMNKLKPMLDIRKTFNKKIDDGFKDERIVEFKNCQEEAVNLWIKLANNIGERSQTNKNEIASVATEFLMLSGYIMLGYQWVLMASVASESLSKGGTDPIYQSKIDTAQFYFDKVFTRTEGLFLSIKNGMSSTCSIAEDSIRL